MTKRAELFVRKIQKALIVSDDLRRVEYRGDDNVFKGHCYISVETLFYFLGGAKKGYKSYVMKVPGGTHWFLKDKQGNVIDPTVKQFKRVPDYGKGRACGFLTKQPSKRAVELMRRMRSI